MIFIYRKWEKFCKQLSNNNIRSICAKDVDEKLEKYLVLKHDVETNVNKAFIIAKIESKYGHKCSYYVQSYLLQSKKNIEILKQMQVMGHEISYHYDVMDSCKGNYDDALKEFEKNKCLFEKNGFIIKTVCQHGNPLIERKGYTSNRDFFRNSKTKKIYEELSDIMVNYKEKFHTDYNYYSDAGRKFKLIYDPINNDLIDTDEKNKIIKDLNELYYEVSKEKKIIVSMHPHRWTKSAFIYSLKLVLFKIIRFIAKIMFKIPFIRKIMSKYYYLAKKI